MGVKLIKKCQCFRPFCYYYYFMILQKQYPSFEKLNLFVLKDKKEKNKFLKNILFENQLNR